MNASTVSLSGSESQHGNTSHATITPVSQEEFSQTQLSEWEELHKRAKAVKAEHDHFTKCMEVFTQTSNYLRSVFGSDHDGWASKSEIVTAAWNIQQDLHSRIYPSLMEAANMAARSLSHPRLRLPEPMNWFCLDIAAGCEGGPETLINDGQFEKIWDWSSPTIPSSSFFGDEGKGDDDVTNDGNDIMRE